MARPVVYHQGRFPPQRLDLERLFPLIGPASAAIARFDGLLSAIPNADVLLSPLTTQEAVLSSKIEGTQATMGEVLEFEAGKDVPAEQKRGDIQEILNYRSALQEGVEQLSSLPLSLRLIRNVHGVLMTGVRGKDKDPGNFRRLQNWIGAPGCNVDGARFVPPSADQVANAMSAWERFIHAETIDPLVQLAVLHAEFEAIHPFFDGNGRLGRLFIPLFLFSKKLIGRPNFYMSAYLEARRDEYYDRLLAVSRDDDWTGWCAFFLSAVESQAQDNTAKARAILNLYGERSDWIAKTTRSHHAVKALGWFFKNPIFNTSRFVASTGIPKATASRILHIVRKRRLLRVVREASGRRPGILAFTELLNITEGRKVF